MGRKNVKKHSYSNRVFTGVKDAGLTASAYTEVQKDIRDRIIQKGIIEQNDLYRRACSELNNAQKGIKEVIATNRGGESGSHGFIAEHLQVGVGNAKSIMAGKGIKYVLIDNNGRDDLLMNGRPVQMKFVQKALSLDAVKEHIEKYPEAINEGEIYMIPKDYWEKLQTLWNTSKEEAGKLRNDDYRLWMKLHDLSEDGLQREQLKAADFTHNAAQRETYQDTISDCNNQIKEERDIKIDRIIKDNGPSIGEAFKTMAVGAGIEGALSGVFIVYEKHIEGVDPMDYTSEDMRDIFSAIGKGILNGGARSGFVYIFANYTPIPAGVASGAFTMAGKAIDVGARIKKEEITKEEAADELIESGIEVGLTTACALLGSVLLPGHKVIGSLVGTAAAKGILFVGKKIINNNTVYEERCA